MKTTGNDGETSYDLTVFLTGHDGYRLGIGSVLINDSIVLHVMVQPKIHNIFFTGSRSNLETELHTLITVENLVRWSNTA